MRLIAPFIFSLMFSSISLAQNKVVVVPLFDSTPTGVAAIPIYCRTATANVLEAFRHREVTCFRADNRSIVTPVPDGHFLLVTDVVGNNNTRGFTSGARIHLGRLSGSGFPALPDIEITHVFPNSFHKKYATPPIILREGERLRLSHGGEIQNLPVVNVDVDVNGYLVKANGFGG